MLIMRYDTHITDYNRIVKYHEKLDGFQHNEIKKIMKLLYNKYKLITVTEHYITKSKNHLPDIDKLLRCGKCFEYKMVDDKYLYRVAIRLNGKYEDYIYIIQPIYYNEGILLKLITSYTNNKYDKHNTLNTKRYA